MANRLHLDEWTRTSVLALLAANLVPLGGVAFFNWGVFSLVFLFWIENLIVGAFNVVRMILVKAEDPGGTAAKLFLIPFFCVHYGFFTMVHGVFVFALFGEQGPGGPFPSWGRVVGAVREEHLGWAVLGLTLSHGYSLVTNYLRGGEYRRATLPQLMIQPYGRIVVLHVALLGGGFLLLALGSPAAGLFLLLGLKVVLDVKAHLWERRRFGPDSSKAASPAVS